VPGTTMPPWRDHLDAAEHRLLARYVRSLYFSGTKEGNEPRP
jgi:mono/diheme cytochrome c family protein